MFAYCNNSPCADYDPTGTSIQPRTTICNDGNNNPYGDRYIPVPEEYEDGGYYEVEHFVQREFKKIDAVTTHPERIPMALIYGFSARFGIGAGLASGFTISGVKAAAGAHVDFYSVSLKRAEITTGTYSYAGASIDTPIRMSVYAQIECEDKGDWHASLGASPNIIPFFSGSLYFGFGWSWDISYDVDAFFDYMIREG